MGNNKIKLTIPAYLSNDEIRDIVLKSTYFYISGIYFEKQEVCLCDCDKKFSDIIHMIKLRCIDTDDIFLLMISKSYIDDSFSVVNGSILLIRCNTTIKNYEIIYFKDEASMKKEKDRIFKENKDYSISGIRRTYLNCVSYIKQFKNGYPTMSDEEISKLLRINVEVLDNLEYTGEIDPDPEEPEDKNVTYYIEYYYDGVRDDSKTESKIVKIGTIISDYNSKPNGKEFSKIENFPLTVTENGNNVIRVYYITGGSPIKKVSYTVEYYYNGIKDATKTENLRDNLNATINSYTDKVIADYELDRVEGIPLVLSENAFLNIIKVYYKLKKVNYSIEYYFDDVRDDSKTEVYTVDAKTLIETVEKKTFENYKYDKTEGLPLTVSTLISNVIKIFYKKIEVNYTVEYYFDNIKNDILTENKVGYQGDIIDSYSDNSQNKYNLEKVEGIPLTLKEGTDNIIKVYYIIKLSSYSVEYYFDKVRDDSKTENFDNIAVDSTIVNYTNHSEDGKFILEKTENLPLTVNVDTSLNIIKIYYKTPDATKVNYTVEYYYDGVKDDSKSETHEVDENTIITSYTDKAGSNYKLKEALGLPLTVVDGEENLIKVYYEIKIIDYSVEYYYDGILDSTRTVNDKDTIGTIITTYDDKSGGNYDLERVDNLPLTLSDGRNNVIKVYYTIKIIPYIVEYYFDNIKDDTLTDNKSGAINTEIISYTDKVKENFTFSKVEGLPLILVEGETAIIKVYYISKTSTYTIEYYFDEVKDDTLTENIVTAVGSTVSGYTDNAGTNYILDKTEGLPLVIKENETNLIKVFYVMKTARYIIEYYFDGKRDDTLTERNTVKINTVINSYTDKIKENFVLESTENYPLTVSVDGNNVIKIMYATIQIPYTIEYYFDGVRNDDLTETLSDKINTTIENYTDNKGTDYNFEKTENLPLILTENGNNTIKVYYLIKKVNYTVEYYFNNVRNDDLTETNEVAVKSVITTYSHNPGNNYTEVRTMGLPLTVLENSSNIIKVYFELKKANYTIEYYYDGEIDNTETVTKEVDVTTVISNYLDKSYDEYNLEKTENLPLTVSVDGNNTIKVYYKTKQVIYTVKYYYNDVLDETKTFTSELTNINTVINSYPDKAGDEYEVGSVTNYPLTLTETGNNLIEVYYITKSLNYKIEYYYDGVIDNNKTVVIETTLGAVIENYEDKLKENFILSKVEGIPLTITINKENVIRVFYENKGLLSYTVEYYYNDILDDTKTETHECEEFFNVNSYTEKIIDNYFLKDVTNFPLSVTTDGNNVIKVYYINVIDYVVKYYYDGKVDETKTENIKGSNGSIIKEYTKKTENDTYELDNLINIPLELTPNMENNVIEIKYISAESALSSYTVNYYLNGILSENLTKIYDNNVRIGTEVLKEHDVIEGYTFEKEENNPLIITDNPSNNIIKLYYINPDKVVDYTIETYYDDIKQDSLTVTRQGNIDDYISLESGVDYEFSRDDTSDNVKLLDSINVTSLVLKADNSLNVFKLNYITYDKTDDTIDWTVYRKLYYYDNELDNDSIEIGRGNISDVIDTYTENTNVKYELDKVEGIPLTLSKDYSQNEIKVYYTRKLIPYTIEYYFDGVIDDSKTENLKIQINSTVNKYTNYRNNGEYLLDKTEGFPLVLDNEPTLPEEKFVGKVYYKSVNKIVVANS